MATIILLLSLLFSFLLTPIQAWTSRFSTPSSGRFFPTHNNNNAGVKSLRATENHAEEDETNDDEVGGTKNSKKNNNDKKKGRRRVQEENESYLSKLENLFHTDDTSFSSTLLNSFTNDDEYDDDDDTYSSPGQSLLYGEKTVVVLGDWMGWGEETNNNGEGGSGSYCVGDSCGDDSEQCDIPEHYKEFKGAPKVDVMSFLGIKRAEPIQVQRDWD